jgi:hypothetical protein
MQFNHTMDRGYQHAMDPPSTDVDGKIPTMADLDPVVSVETIGESVALMGQNTNPVQGVGASIRKGMGHVELCPWAAGRAGQGQMNAEGVDKNQREDLKALVTLNQVDMSIHSSPQVWGMAGFDNKEGFNEREQKKNEDEIRKTIDLASDVSTSGSIVVHTGEFPRSLSKVQEKSGKQLFEEFPGEAEKATHYLVDGRTGRVIKSVREDEMIFRPEQDKDSSADDGNAWLKDETGEFVHDDLVNLHMYEFAVESGKSETEARKIAEKESRIPIWKHDENGNIQTHGETFGDFSRRMKGTGWDESDIYKEFYKEQQQAQIQSALGSARQFEEHYRDGLKRREKIIEALNHVKELKQKLPEDEHWKLKQTVSEYVGQGVLRPDVKDPEDYLKELLEKNAREIAYGRETSLSGRRQAREFLRSIDKVETVEEYGKQRSAEAYGRLGYYAMLKSKKSGHPLFLTLENLYPETYGGHIEELMCLVEKSRTEMAQTLMKQGRSKSEAKELATKHIKTTLDTGHLNMWKKYFKRTDSESEEGYDKRFKKWATGQMKKLIDADMVGNVHLADNLGFEDAHLVPGTGSAPVKEALELLKSKGYKHKMITEGGYDQGRDATLELWSDLGSPIYSVGKGTQQKSFSQVFRGYYGFVEPVNYLVGDTSPSQDWQLWSETRLE